VLPPRKEHHGNPKLLDIGPEWTVTERAYHRSVTLSRKIFDKRYRDLLRASDV
jgi:hypothetical protein